ncbi:MAG: hypothetical protein HKK67_08140 [Chlorobiaceae bacterium]|nr:hypothetical protein [Chlorobiaceae bacterium]
MHEAFSFEPCDKPGLAGIEDRRPSFPSAVMISSLVKLKIKIDLAFTVLQ